MEENRFSPNPEETYVEQMLPDNSLTLRRFS